MKQDLIKAYDMLPNEGIVLCAVSGGADSMCLLSWLQELSEKYGYTVAAAHYHHGLRGEAADRDEAFVREYCENQNIPFYVEHGDVKAAAQEHGWSVEEAGRNLRYGFLNRTAEKIGAVRIATAHHRGDNAETLLLNLIRGSGLTGLSGIAPVRGIFIRPLLDSSRQEIETYLQQRHLSYMKDETNDELVYTRNRIRHEVLPLLQELNPKIEETLHKTAILLRQDDTYLRKVTERVCADVCCSEGTVALKRAVLVDLPPALQSRVLRRMLDLLSVSKKDITARHIRAILDLVYLSGPTAQLSLPHGIVARNVYEDLQISVEASCPWERTALPPVGEIEVGRWRICCRVAEGPVQIQPGRLVLDNEKIDMPPFVDRWQENGWMSLPGSDGSRSLKRLFVDAGISVKEREEMPVIYVGNRIAAVPGIGVDRNFAEKEQGCKYVLDFYKR